MIPNASRSDAQPLAFDLVVKVAERCNLACPYCYYYFKEYDANASTDAWMSDEVLAELPAFVARSLATLDIAQLNVVIHGGEPLLMRKGRFDALCTALRAVVGDSAILRLGVQTNGVLIDDSWVALFERHAVKVGVSIDGPRAVHDAHRVDHHGRGSYDAAVRGLRLLQEAVRKGRLAGVGAMAVVTGGSGEQTLRHLVTELGVTAPNLSFPRGGWGSAEAREWNANLDAHRKMVRYALEHLLTPQFHFVRNVTDVVVALHSDRGAARNDRRKSCRHYIATISGGGQLSVDDNMFGVDEGYARSGLTIFGTSLRDLIESASWRELDRAVEMVPEDCRGCEWFRSCRSGDLYNRFAAHNRLNNKSAICDTHQMIHEEAASYLLRTGLVTLRTLARRLDRSPTVTAGDALRSLLGDGRRSEGGASPGAAAAQGSASSPGASGSGTASSRTTANPVATQRRSKVSLAALSIPFGGAFLPLAEALTCKAFKTMAQRVSQMADAHGVQCPALDLERALPEVLSTCMWSPELGSLRYGFGVGVGPADCSWLVGQLQLVAFLGGLIPALEIDIVPTHPVAVAGRCIHGERLHVRGEGHELTIEDPAGVLLRATRFADEGLPWAWAARPTDIVRVGSSSTAVVATEEWIRHWTPEMTLARATPDLASHKEAVEHAFTLMEEAAPAYYVWTAAMLREIVFAEEAILGGTESQSYTKWPGQIRVSAATALQTIVMLVHECSHQYFNLAMWFGPVADAGAPEEYSVLKSENRPLWRHLLGLHAFGNVQLALDTLARGNAQLDARELKEQREHSAGIVRGLDAALQRHAGHLTDLGRDLYLPLRARLVEAGWLQESRDRTRVA